MKGPHDRSIQGGPFDKADKSLARLRQFERAREPCPPQPQEPAGKAGEPPPDAGRDDSGGDSGPSA